MIDARALGKGDGCGSHVDGLRTGIRAVEHKRGAVGQHFPPSAGERLRSNREAARRDGKHPAGGARDLSRANPSDVTGFTPVTDYLRGHLQPHEEAEAGLTHQLFRTL
jgi:hypothetical protein